MEAITSFISSTDWWKGLITGTDSSAFSVDRLLYPPKFTIPSELSSRGVRQPCVLKSSLMPLRRASSGCHDSQPPASNVPLPVEEGDQAYSVVSSSPIRYDQLRSACDR